MAFQGSRFMLFHRLVLLPPLVLLTLTCLYTSSTLSPFSSTHHLSFSQDAQCFSCDVSPSPSRSFLSVANFRTSYIKDVVLRHSALKVEDSRGETSTEPVSRRDTNEVERVGPKSNEDVEKEFDPHPDTLSRIRQEELSHSPAIKEVAALRESVPPPPAKLDEKAKRQQREEIIIKVELGNSTREKGKLTVGRDESSQGENNVREIIPSPVEKGVGTREDVLQSENRHLTNSDGHVALAEQVEMAINVSVNVAEVVPASAVESSEPAKKEVIKYSYENMTAVVKKANLEVEKLMDGITTSGLPGSDRNSPLGPGLDRNLMLRGGSPQGIPVEKQKTCEGRYVFVYELPTKFNVDLVGQCGTLLRWFNFCPYFINEGMGTTVPTDELNDRGEKVLVPDGSWYLTHQYALELIFHARLKHYPCLTADVNLANLFFVPYYAGLDVIRWHFKANVTNDRRDELTFDLLSWLESQETWTRNKGIDHVFVLGKIGWDFRRSGGNNSHWGSKLLRIPSMWSPTKVLIERDPWHGNDIGVPHPTFFHPKNDDEIRTWLTHVEQSERRHLVSFAGMPRPNMLGNVRGHLIQQCLDHPHDCFLLRCVKTLCMRPDSTMNLFLHSHFCMQPPGDSPTRRSVFDSLVGGCIPVLFDPYTAYYQYPWHLPQNASSYSVFIPSRHVMQGNADIVEILKNISLEERTAMRARIIREIIPGLLYSEPGTSHSDFRDAFDISIEALLHRVANLRAKQAFL